MASDLESLKGASMDSLEKLHDEILEVVPDLEAIKTLKSDIIEEEIRK